MHVAFEAPADPGVSSPVVLVHGGGGQGTDWMAHSDGTPGWADLFVDTGHPAYVVDRVGHGRSTAHPDVSGPVAPPFGYEAARGLFLPLLGSPGSHSRWEGGADPGGRLIDRVVASASPMPRESAASQAADAARLTELLDLIGPAIVVSHSAGAPCVWLAAALRPGAVRAIVAVEPQGPPFSARMPGAALVWGITRAALPFDPPANRPEDLERPYPRRRIPGLEGVPVAVVTSSQSPSFEAAGPEIVAFLTAVGADAESVRLEDAGVEGNGHGLIFESNSDATFGVALDWLRRRLP
jgi:pimeloyl-ACP methyl ester carboxylesterase